VRRNIGKLGRHRKVLRRNAQRNRGGYEICEINSKRKRRDTGKRG
jgi:hypothetical protein